MLHFRSRWRYAISNAYLEYVDSISQILQTYLERKHSYPNTHNLQVHCPLKNWKSQLIPTPKHTTLLLILLILLYSTDWKSIHTLYIRRTAISWKWVTPNSTALSYKPAWLETLRRSLQQSELWSVLDTHAYCVLLLRRRAMGAMATVPKICAISRHGSVEEWRNERRISSQRMRDRSLYSQYSTTSILTTKKIASIPWKSNPVISSRIKRPKTMFITDIESFNLHQDDLSTNNLLWHKEIIKHPPLYQTYPSRTQIPRHLCEGCKGFTQHVWTHGVIWSLTDTLLYDIVSQGVLIHTSNRISAKSVRSNWWHWEWSWTENEAIIIDRWFLAWK